MNISYNLIFKYLVLVSLVLISACSQKSENQNGSVEELTAVMHEVLRAHSIETWYPLVMDTLHGGYLSDFTFDWQPQGEQHKMIVSQARHIWTTSRLAEFYNDLEGYRSYAAQGVEFLQNKMWDVDYGGFYNLVDQQGKVIANSGGDIQKNAYGNAFAIYGLAAYYRVFKDPQALEMAKATFNWLDKHSHDSLYGGYFQFLARDGTPYVDGFEGTPPKDQNSSIHLMEAFSELYQVWPDERLQDRLDELFILIRDTITTDQGYMNLFFQQDWTPFKYGDSLQKAQDDHFNLDHVSFGHDIETAYLLMEASEVLGQGHDSTTLSKSKRMVDHTLEQGWDNEAGGIFDGGYYFDSLSSISIIKKGKVWWAQAEALNTLLIMSDLYPQDEHEYYEKYLMQWNYIMENLIDEEYGGWYWSGLDMEPERKTFPKGQIWKVNYHTVRSLVNCIERMEAKNGDPEF